MSSSNTDESIVVSDISPFVNLKQNQHHILNDKFENLESLLRNISSTDPTALVSELQKIRVSSHLFFNQWKSLAVDPTLVQKFIDIVQKYESNGLQLYGLGCWVLEKLLKLAPQLIGSTKYSETYILELTLRIIVEHTNHNTFISVFSCLVSYKSEFLRNICQIGNVFLFFCCKILFLIHLQAFAL